MIGCIESEAERLCETCARRELRRYRLTRGGKSARKFRPRRPANLSLARAAVSPV